MNMKVEINNQLINVFITRKRQKNTYLRVKEDMNIYVTTNYFTSSSSILNLIQDNQANIVKMLDRMAKKKSCENEFFYLGKQYNLVLSNLNNIILGENTIFYNNKTSLDKWLIKQAKVVFQEELAKMYEIFPVTIPYPSLTIRKMKTRWGVCNTKTKRVTLNLELIKKDLKYLDYVIIHELSHLIYPNHGSDFWNLVSKSIPDYKKLRKELNSYE